MKRDVGQQIMLLSVCCFNRYFENIAYPWYKELLQKIIQKPMKLHQGFNAYIIMTTTKWFLLTRKKTREFIKLYLKIHHIFIFITSPRSFFVSFRDLSSTAKVYFDLTNNKFLKDVPTCLLNIDFFSIF